tara:strand:+ start:192 stop:1535 length:1344 start_codon:yes stop_codon:yes gene_type:complete
MSPTHDMIIDNSTGANVRADINNALAALVSNSSSSSEPSTKYAYQFWADTTNGILKIRNAANNAWINLFTLSGGIDVDAASNFNEDVTFTGASYNVVWDKSDNALEFADNAKCTFGASDLSIYHDGSHSRIVDSGTGNLILQTSKLNVNNADGSEGLIHAAADGKVELFYDNSVKCETQSTGVKIINVLQVGDDAGSLLLGNSDGFSPTFTENAGGLEFRSNNSKRFTFTLGGDMNFENNRKLAFGGSNQAMQLYHDGSNAYIDVGTGAGVLHLRSADDIKLQTNMSELMVKCDENASVHLYYDGTERVKTVSNGFTVRGKSFIAREDGTTADYVNFKVAFYQSIAASTSHTFQVGSVYAMGTVNIFGSRGAGANNATVATGKIYPIHIRAGATAGLGSQIGSDLGGASGGFSYSVAAGGQGITVTNNDSTYAMNTFVTFDLTGFVG